MLMQPDRGRKDILQEYYDLAVRCDLSELEAERMVQILQLAEEDDILSFWLNEIDYLLSEEMKLLEDSNIRFYADEQAKLREYLETKVDTAKEDIDETLEKRIKTLSIKLQQQLRKRGYYDGSIDGEVGPRTRKALKIFQKDNHIHDHGYFSPTTLNILGVL